VLHIVFLYLGVQISGPGAEIALGGPIHTINLPEFVSAFVYDWMAQDRAIID
jgi:hypothetical protein